MIDVTKRRLMLLTAAAAAAPRAVRAQSLPANEAALYEGAKKEGGLTWYTGQMQAEPSEAIGRAFTARFPGVKCDVVRSTSEVAYQRLSQDIRAGVTQCDVFSSTDLSHATALKKQGRLLQFTPANEAGMIEAGRKAADPDGFYHITYMGVYQLARNSAVVSDADAPKSWKDLTDPKWRGKIAVGHPSYSGAITAWCILMKKLYGWEYFTALEKNKPQIGRSSADPVTLLAAKERVIGASIPAATTRISISRGNPLVLIYPSDKTLLVPSPSGVLKAAPHPNAAKLFMEFSASPDYYNAVHPFFEDSLRPETPPYPGAKPLAEIDFMSATATEVERQGEEVRESWRDTFGV